MKNPYAMIIGGFSLLFAVAMTSCTTATTDSHAEAKPAAANETASAAANAGGSGTPVVLTPFFNLTGIYPDGVSFSDGLDGDGFACSSNLLTSPQTWSDKQFVLSPPRAGFNVIACAGQTIPLPPGKFSKIQILATAVNGEQAEQHFTISYSDASMDQTFTQTLSDWASPDSNSGETVAATMAYRDQSDGTHDDNSFYLFAYSFDLKAGTATSIKLPDNQDVKVFAITLVP